MDACDTLFLRLPIIVDIHIGESNAGNWQQYNCSFPAMIGDWRNKFNTNTNGLTNAQFPFGFVQVRIF